MQHKTYKVNLSLVNFTLLNLPTISQQSRCYLSSSSSSTVQKAGNEQQTTATFRATGKGKRNNNIIINPQVTNVIYIWSTHS